MVDTTVATGCLDGYCLYEAHLGGNFAMMVSLIRMRNKKDAAHPFLKDIAMQKCQILVRDSPADIYRGDAHKNCVLRARENGLEFLVFSLVDERLMEIWDDESRDIMLHVHF